MIEYHKCRVSSFSNWGKAASPEKLKHEAAVDVCVEINQCVGCSRIEQASRRWCGGRRDDSARTRRKILMSAQVAALTAQIQLIELEASQRDPLF